MASIRRAASATPSSASAGHRPALWIGLHLPALPLEAWAASLSPEQQRQPLVLMAGARLQAVNAEAARCGLQVGMKRATALALAPQVIRGQADAAREAEALLALAYAALQFTPSVSLYDPATVLLEVSTTQRAMGGLPRLLEQLRAVTSRWGFTQRLVTAPTAGGAALLARWPGSDVHHKCERMLSLEALKDLIDHAPLILLKAAAEHAAQLQLMGVSTVADLRALPREGLTRRLGPELLAELDGICGAVPQAHDWVSLPDCFEARLELFSRADTTEQVLYGAQLLLERLVVWARARRGRIQRLQLQLLHEPRHRRDDTTPERSVLELAQAEPGNDLEHLHVLLRERLSRLPLPAPTSELRISCADLALSEAPSGELFPTRASEQQGLSRLVERLQARLGRDAVRSVQAVADHRPERSTRCEPLNAADLVRDQARHRRRARSDAVDKVAEPVQADQKPLARPVWLLPQPQALRVQRSAPCLDGHPLRLLAGPERIETGWWDGLAARDYFVAQAQDQSLVWIFRARLPLEGPEPEGAAVSASEGGWFLHGRFA
jgi:protein ImuB